jgi:NAD(P)-dependent dehydrogenase (short-subunit alcohol dehydrogenase family)
LFVLSDCDAGFCLIIASMDTGTFSSSDADTRWPPARRNTMINTTNKVAIVTGAAGGIGAAVSERLAQDGFIVVVNYAGKAEPAEALVAKIEAAGGRAVAAQADISDSAAVARLFDTTEAAFGGVDVLVNNAGIMQLATLGESDDALFDRQIAVNLKGTFNTLREASRRLRDGGRIINFSSSVTTMLQPTYGVYAATKAAVEAMTSILDQGTARPGHHRQRHRPRTDRDQAVPRRQAAGGDRPPVEDGPAGASGSARRHRRRSRLPGRTGRRLDQRPDPARQRRHRLNLTLNLPLNLNTPTP